METNQTNSRRELIVDSGRRVSDIVQEMKVKTNDAEIAAKQAMIERNVWKKSMEKNEMFGKNVIRKMITRFNSDSDKLRSELKTKNSKALAFKVRKWSSGDIQQKKMFDDLAVAKYKDLSIFCGEYKVENEAGCDVNVVSDVQLTTEERVLLSNNPKLIENLKWLG